MHRPYSAVLASSLVLCLAACSSGAPSADGASGPTSGSDGAGSSSNGSSPATATAADGGVTADGGLGVTPATFSSLQGAGDTIAVTSKRIFLSQGEEEFGYDLGGKNGVDLMADKCLDLIAVPDAALCATTNGIIVFPDSGAPYAMSADEPFTDGTSADNGVNWFATTGSEVWAATWNRNGSKVFQIVFDGTKLHAVRGPVFPGSLCGLAADASSLYVLSCVPSAKPTIWSVGRSRSAVPQKIAEVGKSGDIVFSLVATAKSLFYIHDSASALEVVDKVGGAPRTVRRSTSDAVHLRVAGDTVYGGAYGAVFAVGPDEAVRDVATLDKTSTDIAITSDAIYYTPHFTKDVHRIPR